PAGSPTMAYVPSGPALVRRVSPVSTFFTVISVLASALPSSVAPASCAQVTFGPQAAEASAEATNDAIRLRPPGTCFFISSPCRNRSRRHLRRLQQSNGYRPAQVLTFSHEIAFVSGAGRARVLVAPHRIPVPPAPRAPSRSMRAWPPAPRSRPRGVRGRVLPVPPCAPARW